MAAVDVVFRTYSDGSVIALFPSEAWGNGLISSFMHIGQHGGANYDGVLSATRASTPDELAPVKRELESAPYEYELNVLLRRR